MRTILITLLLASSAASASDYTAIYSHHTGTEDNQDVYCTVYGPDDNLPELRSVPVYDEYNRHPETYISDYQQVCDDWAECLGIGTDSYCEHLDD